MGIAVCARSEAVEGEPVHAGTIYIARGNWHMEVRSAAQGAAKAMVHLTQGPLENHCRPAVDVLFRSAAAVYGSAVLAVVLTGMGSDGMLGSKAIRDGGGAVIAQDQASSTVWGMPGAVTNAGLAQRVLDARRDCAGDRAPVQPGTVGSSRAKGSGVGMELLTNVDYPFLRQLVFGLSQNVLDPTRDYLFETRLTKVLRNQGSAIWMNS